MYQIDLAIYALKGSWGSNILIVMIVALCSIAFIWSTTRPWHKSMPRDESLTFWCLCIALTIVITPIAILGQTAKSILEVNIMGDILLENNLDNATIHGIEGKVSINKHHLKEVVTHYKNIKPTSNTDSFNDYFLYSLCRDGVFLHNPIFKNIAIEKDSFYNLLTQYKIHLSHPRFEQQHNSFEQLMTEIELYSTSIDKGITPSSQINKNQLSILLSKLNLSYSLITRRDKLKDSSQFGSSISIVLLVTAIIASIGSYNSIKIY